MRRRVIPLSTLHDICERKGYIAGKAVLRALGREAIWNNWACYSRQYYPEARVTFTDWLLEHVRWYVKCGSE